MQMPWQAHTLPLGLLVEIVPVCLSNIAILEIAVSVSSSVFSCTAVCLLGFSIGQL
jgi:hypothetical protein